MSQSQTGHTGSHTHYTGHQGIFHHGLKVFISCLTNAQWRQQLRSSPQSGPPPAQLTTLQGRLLLIPTGHRLTPPACRHVVFVPPELSLDTEIVVLTCYLQPGKSYEHDWSEGLASSSDLASLIHKINIHHFLAQICWPSSLW